MTVIAAGAAVGTDQPTATPAKIKSASHTEFLTVPSCAKCRDPWRLREWCDFRSFVRFASAASSTVFRVFRVFRGSSVSRSSIREFPSPLPSFA